MKMIDCPLTGPRPASEFVCGGEVQQVADPTAHDDTEWADYLFQYNNLAGVVREWWFHTPTASWFIAERDTTSDEFLRTYPASELYQARVAYAAPPAEEK